MNARIAKKVIARYWKHPESYRQATVTEAHTILGMEPIAAHKERYDVGLAAEKTLKAEVQADLVTRQDVNKLKAVIKEKVRAAKAKAKLERVERIAKLEAERKAAIIKGLPKETVTQVGAVEVKIEAGDDGILGTEDDDVTIQKAGTALSEMNLAELKAEAKSRSLKGYSKLKKDELFDILLKA